MIYSHEVERMCPVTQGVKHGAAPIPEEAKWVKVKDVSDISGLTLRRLQAVLQEAARILSP